MHNILLASVRLHSEAVVWRGFGKYVLLYDEKSVFHLLVRGQFTDVQC